MAASVSGKPASGAETDDRSRHILLVEDHPVVLNATRSLLEAHGYRVTSATSLAEAIERTRDHHDLDLLITDYHLAGTGTGKQVVSAVRAMCGPDLKAIVITGDTGSAVHQFDSDSGLCWMAKPVNAAQLLTLLKHLFELHRAQ
jgi:two-component system, sensor histidine kinase